ncbi:tetratricopeptide repeat protein, partial [Streptomyces phaeochromogenes]|uniref:tetratricopeptide repeat protein n=1 Tax=Streptomyces phaeochromogenes TaxID=1923 RepID=UPI0037119DBA
VAQERGDLDRAQEYYRMALTIKEELGDRSGIAGVYHQLGLIAQERGEYPDAEERYRASLSISEELGDRSGVAASYGQLGSLRTVQQRPDEGVPYTLQALSICTEIGVSPYAALFWLARQRALMGDDAFGALIGDLLPANMAPSVMNATQPQAEASSDEASIDRDGPTTTVQA